MRRDESRGRGRLLKKQSDPIIAAISRRERRWLAPEVIQTSAMDCGPAALTCLLEGFGISASYGRLREACQTDVDGTSIDTLEAIAGRLGLEAEQVMVPADHLVLPEAAALPALLVVRLPNGFTHFVVVWRRHGPLVQVMDPAVGRRWLTVRRLVEDAYVHSFVVPAAGWQEWARSEEFRGPLARRLRDLGAGGRATAWVDEAAQAAEWRPLARLDAAARLTASLAAAGGVRRGAEACRLLEALIGRARGPAPTVGRAADEAPGEYPPAGAEARGRPTVGRAADEAPGEAGAIPETYWSVRPAPAGEEGEERLRLRGAVLVRIRGRKADAGEAAAQEGLSPELAAALTEPPSRPGRELARALRGCGRAWLALLAGGLLVASAGTVVEALLLRGMMGLAGQARVVGERLGALAYLVVFVGALLLVEWRVGGGLLRLGRLVEGRLRAAFARKIPLLHDRYFHSRPISDMAERSHTLHQLRRLPVLAGQLVRVAMTLAVTAGAVCWLDPASAPLALAAAGAAIGLPLAFRAHLVERDLRVRTHTGALSRFYLDALLGLTAIRAHTAERPVRREYEGLLAEWADASLRFVRSLVVLETLVLGVGFGLAGWLLVAHAQRGADPASSLLLAYWALQLPILGDQLAGIVAQYPLYRNLVLRAAEPLGAPEEPRGAAEAARPLAESGGGVAIALRGVTVRAAGRVILAGIDAQIEAGSHVAIVGPSGAGKSSLVGLLLGWHRPAEGAVLVDGDPLDGARLDRLREETAWVDPAVQLWNRPLAENLTYGEGVGGPPLDEVVSRSGLEGVLERLGDGSRTPLGESGGLLAGGEGQRVRFGRALRRGRPRLAILDEPFRGLDHATRHELLRRAREHWRAATLLCITHDLAEANQFDRVLVVEAGRIVEDGPPGRLAGDPRSRYRGLLDAERAVQEGLWSRPTWRRVRLEDGRLAETAAGEVPQ